MKVCSKCHIEKDESEFYKHTKGGLFAECKKCNNERGKKYKKTNWEKVKAKHDEYIEKHPNLLKEYEKRRRIRHPKRLFAYYKKYWKIKKSEESYIRNERKRLSALYRKDIDSSRAYNRKMQKEYIKKLSDWYVRRTLVVSNIKNISDDLIEIKRVIIKIKRYAKEKKNPVNQKHSRPEV